MKQPGAKSATELFASGVSTEAWQQGRRLKLFFDGGNRPELDRIEFHANEGQREKYGFLQRGHGLTAKSFRWTEMPQALARFFLEYLNAGLHGRSFAFRRVPQADSLADAVSKSNGKLYTLFVEHLPDGGTAKRVDRIFDGVNLHGKNPGERSIWVKADYLPPACVEIFWERRQLTKRDEVEKFTRLFLKSWKMPPLAEPELPAGEGSKKEPEAKQPPPEKESSQPRPEEPGPAKKPKPEPKESKPNSDPPLEKLKMDTSERETSDEFKPQPEPESPRNETPPPRKIDPRLFEIQNPHGYTWEDNEPLLNFGDDRSKADVWRIRDACEGIAVFGAVGSGKTSGSGSAIARAFLQAGFGGLVLTVKPDEARRWQRMCQETGRAGDFIHVTPASGHKLNFLQYEIQRPGERLAVTDDLIALFRTLIGVMSRSKRGEVADDFWTNTTNQLMRKLTDIFLLAGEPLTLDRMVRFINRAPKNAGQDWRNLEMFADVIERAGEKAQDGGDEDKRVYQECFEYWTDAYPAIADVTRSGFITAFSAMADVLSGRGIHEMIGTETNLTPELILSGKIVVLDIPLKGNIQGGMMVQSMWKLLFQQAAERRADKGLPTARPAFLWEDEGHMFFSQNDVNFQPTARDIRAPHVIISQNLQNFYQQGHNQHAVEAVFAAMNTCLFHTNGEMMTNRWASEKIGEVRKLKLTTDGLLKPLRDKDISFFDRRPEDVKNIGTMRIAEEKKTAMPPEDFAKLKRGGDGTCEAILVWLSHQFAANNNRNFCVLTFTQEPR